MGVFSTIKNFLSSNKKGENIDVNKPVINPKLKEAFADFSENKTEVNLQAIVNELKTAIFLMIIITNQQLTKETVQGTFTFEKGSIIKFYMITDADGNTFYPLFTDWNEIDLWLKTRDGFAGLISPAVETYDFVLKADNINGLVINPGSDKWAMGKKQIEELVSESR